MLKKIVAILIFSYFILPTTANAFNYQECMTKAAKIGLNEEAKCKHSDMLINLKKIQDIYDVLANDKELKVMSRNDVKKMYDNWIAYRDSYCNLYAHAQVSYTPDYNKEHCKQEQTRNAWLYMRAITDNLYEDPE